MKQMAIPLIISWLMGMMGTSIAQHDVSFGQNIYRPRPIIDWYVKRYEGIEFIYFGDKGYADVGLRLSVKAYDELSRFFDYQLSDGLQVQFYPTPLEYTLGPWSDNAEMISRRGNAMQSFPYNGNGLYSPYVQQVPISTTVVYFNGNYAEFMTSLKSEMALTFVHHMFYGSSNRGARSNRLHFYLPAWFKYGLSSYLGQGWTSQDESIMRSLSLSDFEDLMTGQSNSVAARTVQRSFWHFVANSQGKKRLSEIVYMCRLTRSIESGFHAVLGFYTETLYVQWLEYCRNQYLDQPGFAVNEIAQELDLPKSHKRMVSCATNDRLPRLAYITEDKGRFTVQIYNTKLKKYQLLRRTGGMNRNIALNRLTYPINWTANGDELAYVLPAKKGLTLYYHNLRTNQALNFPLKDQFDWVNQISFSPDGRRLVLSAVAKGRCDLWVSAAGFSKFTALTADPYDDLYPIWTNDGKGIFFSSNRDTALNLNTTSYNYQFVDNTFDIYALKNIGGESTTLARVTQTGEWDEIHPRLRGKALSYLSNQFGVYNLTRHAPDRPLAITHIREGVNQQSNATKRHLLGAYQDGKMVYFQVDSLAIPEGTNIPVSSFVSQRKQAYEQRMAQKKMWELAAQQTANVTKQPEDTDSPDEKEAETSEPSSANDQDQDTAAQKSSDVRYYVFDDDTAKVRRRPISMFKRRNTPSKANDSPKKSPEKPLDINEIRMIKSGAFADNLYYKTIRATIESDQIWGLNLHGRAILEDPMGNYRLIAGFRPFSNLASYDIYLRGQYYKRRFQYELAIERASRLNNTAPQTMRYNVWTGQASILYPINPYNRLSLTTSINRFNRIDLNLLDDSVGVDNSASAFMGGIELAYVLDNSVEHQSYTKRGWKARVSARAHLGFAGIQSNFSELRLDIRKYTPIVHSWVLALRASSGALIGPDLPSYLFGGVDHWVNPTFDNRQQLPFLASVEKLHFTQAITPVRGFGFNARNGTHFVLLNAELRYPLGKLFASLLPTRSMYNMVGGLYYDIGTVWRTGNPLSQRNPIDVQTIYRPPFTITVRSLKSPFIMGVGVFYRMLISSYAVRIDAGVPVDDGTVSRVSFGLSLGKEF